MRGGDQRGKQDEEGDEGDQEGHVEEGMVEGQGTDEEEGRMEVVEDCERPRAQEGCAPATDVELEEQWAGRGYQLAA